MAKVFYCQIFYGQIAAPGSIAMFKRKVLPARPVNPTSDEIHQDIACASEDDSVFKLATHNGEKH